MKVVGFAGMALLLVSGCGTHPTDANLQAALQKNYPAFSNIVTQFKVSSVERVEWDGSKIIVDSGLRNPTALTSKLKPSFQAIGQPLIVVNAGSEIRIYFSVKGLSVSGSGKGIVFTETMPARIVPDTDASSPTNAPYTVFRPLIQTNWFAFYSR